MHNTRARTHPNSSHPLTHSVGMCLGFYRPQKDLSWAENQKFKVALIFGTFPSLFHGVQYCTIGLESPRPLRGRGLYNTQQRNIKVTITDSQLELVLFPVEKFNCVLFQRESGITGRGQAEAGDQRWRSEVGDLG